MASRTKATVVAGLGEPLRWTDSEQKIWVPYMFLGAMLVYAARGALPITVVEMAEEFDWDKKMRVR